ncbi:transposase [Streptomyces sp. NPDC001530]|uniref:transposase n=1 Tax=Streptomyces sp. NPDC001530 TaxID=3364582 RepID=UPI0036BB7BAD
MTDAEWAAVRPLLPTPSWPEGRGGRPEGYCHRQMLDAIRYLVAGGISWRAMPADFPCRPRVYAFFRRWREHGLTKEFLYLCGNCSISRTIRGCTSGLTGQTPARRKPGLCIPNAIELLSDRWRAPLPRRAAAGRAVPWRCPTARWG